MKTLYTTLFLVLAGSAAKAQLCFSVDSNYAAESNPRHVIVDDFNNDNELDIALCNFDSSRVVILFGNASGVFSAPSHFTTGPATQPDGIASGDFNGDGNEDIATANFGTDNVSILLGNGAGNFGSPTFYTTGQTAYAITLNDFNGDTILDFATANYGASTNSVTKWIGTGTGTFTSTANYTTGNSVYAAAITSGDFNGDNHIDLAVTNQGNNKVAILLGTGAGTFGAATYFNTGSYPHGICTADFNNDSILDLAISDYGSDDIMILTGDGLGGFGSPVTKSVGSGPNVVIAEDFDGDSVLDLAVTNINAGNFSVLVGNGTGGFANAVNFNVGLYSDPVGLAAGDFNHDGDLDLAVSRQGYNQVSVFFNCTSVTTGIADANESAPFSIYPNPGNGIFMLNTTLANGEVSVCNVLGETIFSSAVNSPTTTIDLSGKANGVYLVTVKNDKGSFTQKIVKQD